MGTLRVITPPTQEPVTLAEAKTALRVDISDDDTRITNMIKMGREFAENYCHVYIMSQILELTFDAFPSNTIPLNVYPLISVNSVKYDDTQSPSVEQTLTVGTDYVVDTTTTEGRVITVNGWPSTAVQPNAVRIRVTAGHIASPWSVPEAFREGIISYVMYLYDGSDLMLQRAKDLLWQERIL